ncbi:MAG: lipid-A-disaccharide synthase N-terminal domain-containing protein [Candidatus Omnitrophica bacterium]|nr:lipid-A-disaccharide synthase N-terminal domain-containing protein [Candidatus Omnitrophota bacterium]
MVKIDAWLILGFVAQFFFFMRFFVQWVVSEKKGKSVIPNTFWYFSILGGALLLVYSIYRRDPVFILGQSMGLVIYLRNIVLINKEKADAP